MKNKFEDIYTDIGHNIDTYSPENTYYTSKKEHLIEFFDIIKDIISNDTVKEMKNYRQHCNTSCYKHCRLHILHILLVKN